jgi:primase-polymerase (primpol)-like protein
MALGLRIVVAKFHGRQYDHRIPARKLFLFSHYGRSPHTVETSNAAMLLILFQQSNEFGQKIWTIFRSKCLFKEQWSLSSFSRHGAPNIKTLAIAEVFNAVNVGFRQTIL